MHPENNNEEWFTEGALPFAKQDIRISIRTTRCLYRQKSDYGLVEVYDTPFFGRILVIDGIINIADKTEFIYHEMMVTLPAIYHGKPRNVLIIGGGDGGAAKHALRIKSVENITQVEIDKDIIDVCQEFIPQIADGALQNKKVNLIIGDGIEYAKNSKEQFDLVILDVSDPVPGGPAEHLLTEEFYSDVKKLLTGRGVILTHCGSLIFQAEKSKLIVDNLKSLFKNVTMHIALVPEFELTEFGFLVCTDCIHPEKEEVKHRFASLIEGNTQYLTDEVYFSSKTLPPYIQKITGVNNS